MIGSIKVKVKFWYVFILILSGVLLSRCTTFLDDTKYSGIPKSLKYMSIDDYSIGNEFVSDRPTVFGGEGSTFSIIGASGPSSEVVLNESFSIDATNGNINIKEYCRLEQGTYSIDVKVSNNAGSTEFLDAFSFNAVQVIPTKLRYIPSIYSFYGSEMGDATLEPFANGGAPFTFSFSDPLNHFSLHSESGVITKVAATEVDPDEINTRMFDVSVSNEKGEYNAADAIIIEILGDNVGKLIYHNELTQSSIVSQGILNAQSYTFIGEYSTTINNEPYSTELKEGVNTVTYVGSRYKNAWHSYTGSIKLDDSGSGEVADRYFLSFATAGSKVECVSMVVSDSIDLSGAVSATTEIQAYKRFIDSDVNQRIGVLICEEAAYNSENPSKVNWTEINHNIAPGMLSYESPFIESKLKNEGKQEIDIPIEFMGKKVRLALFAEHLNSDINNLGRETFIYRWQVRAKNN